MGFERQMKGRPECEEGVNQEQRGVHQPSRGLGLSRRGVCKARSMVGCEVWDGVVEIREALEERLCY